MTDSIPAYGLWSLVIINSLVFIIFAFSFTKPHSARDWRSFGAFFFNGRPGTLHADGVAGRDVPTGLMPASQGL